MVNRRTTYQNRPLGVNPIWSCSWGKCPGLQKWHQGIQWQANPTMKVILHMSNSLARWVTHLLGQREDACGSKSPKACASGCKDHGWNDLEHVPYRLKYLLVKCLHGCQQRDVIWFNEDIPWNCAHSCNKHDEESSGPHNLTHASMWEFVTLLYLTPFPDQVLEGEEIGNLSATNKDHSRNVGNGAIVFTSPRKVPVNIGQHPETAAESTHLLLQWPCLTRDPRLPQSRWSQPEYHYQHTMAARGLPHGQREVEMRG